MDKEPWSSLPGPLTAEDHLFGDRRPSVDTSCLNFGCHGWDIYAAGYKRAADILVLHVMENGRDLDTVIYPAMYLYRHYIELRLKELVDSGANLLRDDAPKTRTHDIIDLWEKFRKIADKIFCGDDKQEIVAIERIVREFREMDKSGFCFRYPFDTHGNKTLQGVKYISLPDVMLVMEKIEIFLEGCSTAISVYIDNISDLY